MFNFYTLPPRRIPWKYVLVNANKPRAGLSYIKKYYKEIVGVIIDAGVEVFRDPRVKEYLGGREKHIEKLVSLYDRVCELTYGALVLVTIPDYPDDYHPRSLWVNGRTNVDRTIDNIIYALDNYEEVNWLIPVQGFNRDPLSITHEILILRELGILKQRYYYAIANLCVEPSTDLTIKALTIARRELGNKHIHAFGIKKPAIIKAAKLGLINSADSMAWTRPDGFTQKVMKKLGYNKRFSCKNEWQRELYFTCWIYSLYKQLGYDADKLLSNFPHGEISHYF